MHYILSNCVTAPKRLRRLNSNLVDTTPPKPVNEFSWNFVGMFLRIPHFALSTYRAHSMYGCADLFSKIRKNVRNWESVHPYMTILRILGFLKIRTWDFWKSVHFTGIIVWKGPFSSFFPVFFLTLLIFIRKLSYKFPPPENPGK